MQWQSLEELRFASEWSKKAKQLNGLEKNSGGYEWPGIALEKL